MVGGKMKKAVVTLCIGSAYGKLAEATHPTLKAYADKIGAEFVVIRTRVLPANVPIGYEKIQLAGLLDQYDRIVFMDTDLIVRPDTPSLFEFVPEGWFGAFNEGDWMEREAVYGPAVDALQMSLLKPKDWGKRYYNTGVMVFEKQHKEIFQKPPVWIDSFYEQTYLNIQMNRCLKWDFIKNIGTQFNRMSHVDPVARTDSRWENYIIHYAGTNVGGGWATELRPGETLVDLVKRDLKTWDEMRESGYHIKRKYKISVGGGLGDQIDAEPLVRELRRLYPKDHLIVASHWPELFEGLDYPIEETVDIRKHYNTQDIVHVFHTYSDPTQDAWNYMTHVLMESTNFSSLLSIRRQLPPEKKEIQIRYRAEHKITMLEKLGVTEDWLKDAILIHPGRSWPTKTIAVSTWNEVVKNLTQQGKKVVLIGKNENYSGPRRGADTIGLVQGLEIPKEVVDARDKLSIKESLALLDSAFALVSNDSAPIHLAGATNIWIIGIFTAKHPAFVLPWRKDAAGNFTQQHKTLECNLRPACWPCNVNAVHTKPSEVRADHCLNFDKLFECHPSAEMILRTIEQAKNHN